jgi:hypothetical protein
MVARIEAACFIGLSAGVLYAFSLPFQHRHPALFSFAVALTLCAFVHAHHLVSPPQFHSNDKASKILLALEGLCSIGLWISFFQSKFALKVKGQ